jgi:hypothetical protein
MNLVAHVKKEYFPTYQIIIKHNRSIQNTETIPGQHSIDSIHKKSAVLGTLRIIKKMLESET